MVPLIYPEDKDGVLMLKEFIKTEILTQESFIISSFLKLLQENSKSVSNHTTTEPEIDQKTERSVGADDKIDGVALFHEFSIDQQDKLVNRLIHQFLHLFPKKCEEPILEVEKVSSAVDELKNNFDDQLKISSVDDGLNTLSMRISLNFCENISNVITDNNSQANDNLASTAPVNETTVASSVSTTPTPEQSTKTPTYETIDEIIISIVNLEYSRVALVKYLQKNRKSSSYESIQKLEKMFIDLLDTEDWEVKVREYIVSLPLDESYDENMSN